MGGVGVLKVFWGRVERRGTVGAVLFVVGVNAGDGSGFIHQSPNPSLCCDDVIQSINL